MYFVKSRTTATLQHCPASDVPPPRQRMGALNSRQVAIAARTSSLSRGITTPIGNLAVIGGVGRVESAGAVVEADFAADAAAEGFGEIDGVCGGKFCDWDEGGLGSGGPNVLCIRLRDDSSAPLRSGVVQFGLRAEPMQTEILRSA